MVSMAIYYNPNVRFPEIHCNTYTIIARCPVTKQFGAAVASKFPGVGAYSPYLDPEAGIVATQGWVNPTLGPIGIQLLRQGQTANEVLDKLLLEDPGRELRQVAVLDRFGNSAVYTGSENDDVKGHLIRDQYCLSGNLMADETVLPAMEKAFEESSGELADRLLLALQAGTDAGGDRRGKQAAVLKVVQIAGFPYIDFRVDDHPEPVAELRRIYDDNRSVLIDKYYNWVDAVKKGIPLEKKG
jgi:uncharacterized Ntn-hydrolase superfamily protein